MALIRVQVHYRLGVTGKWSNVWHVENAGIGTTDAAFVAVAVPVLLDFLHVSCTLDRLLISNPITHEFTVNVINQNGENGDTGEMLPLFNSVKVLFPSTGFGRPDLKYFKGLLTEGMQANATVAPAVVTAIGTAMQGLVSDMATAGAPLVSDEGDAYATVAVQTLVQMRQMHRKRKKKVTTP